MNEGGPFWQWCGGSEEHGEHEWLGVNPRFGSPMTWRCPGSSGPDKNRYVRFRPPSRTRLVREGESPVTATFSDGSQMVSTVGCARCWGEGHTSLLFHVFLHPVVVGGQRFTHWATCPDTGEPILMCPRVERAPDAETRSGDPLA